MTPPIVAGIDLAGAPEYGTKRYGRVGLAALASDLNVVRLEAGRFKDEEILGFVAESGAEIVAIDAPLSLPAGRCCGDEACDCARLGRVRAVDIALLRAGYRPYWPLIRSMRPLTLRGIALKSQLEERGVTVIEVFPGAVQDALGLPRKQAGLNGLLEGLRGLGLEGFDGMRPDGDKLDGLTAAYMARLYSSGSYRSFAAPGENSIVLPVSSVWSTPAVYPRR